MIVTMNGRVCCLLDLPCCKPPMNTDSREEQIAALGEFLYKAANVPKTGKDDAFQHMARALLEHVILVPRQLLPKGEEPSQEAEPVTHTHPDLLELHETIKTELARISENLGYPPGEKEKENGK